MEGDDTNYELTDDFLMDVVDQCDDMRMQEFRQIFVAGNEQHIKPLLLSAAQLDATFMERLRNASRLSVAARFVEQGDSKGLLDSIGDKPQLIHSRNIDGQCLLHKIAQLQRLDVLNDVVAWQKATGTLVNWDCRDASHNTPLHIAASSGSVEIARALLEAGADVNVQNRNQSEYASGQWGVRGAAGDFMTPICPEHATPLHVAAEQGDVDMLAELLKHKPELETPDSSGMTALHTALEAADEDCFLELLKAGASPTSTNPVFGEGVTCLHNAASRGLHGIAAAILEHCPQVDVNGADAEGWRPLHLAARKGSVKLVELLLAKGADKDALNKQGQTAAYLAEVNKKSAVVALLSKPASWPVTS